MSDSKPSDFVDNTIVTASFTLIAAAIVVLSVSKPPGQWLKFSLFCSVASLALALLCSLWNKARFPKRSALAKHHTDLLSEKLSEELRTFYQNTVQSIATQRFQAYLRQRSQQTPLYQIPPDELQREGLAILQAVMQEQKPILDRFTDSFSSQLTATHKKFMLDPLEEDFARVKYLVDLISTKTRYHLFVIGIVLLLTAFALHLF